VSEDALTRETVWARPEGVVGHGVGTEVTVLHTIGARHLAVIGDGAFLWRLMLWGSRMSDLVGTLVERFGLDDARATGHVESFLSTLAIFGPLA